VGSQKLHVECTGAKSCMLSVRGACLCLRGGGGLQWGKVVGVGNDYGDRMKAR
jgi:hypothetical protein